MRRRKGKWRRVLSRVWVRAEASRCGQASACWISHVMGASFDVGYGPARWAGRTRASRCMGSRVWRGSGPREVGGGLQVM